MKPIHSFLVAVTIAMISCNPSTNPSATPQEDSNLVNVPQVVKITSPACYEQRNAGDTFTLQLKITDTSGVEGALKYGFKEKDSNAGTLAGMMYGDTLIADYYFQSEGKLQ